MRSLARVVVLGIVCVVVASCAATGQQAQSSVHAKCAESCNNVSMDMQGQCIAQCSK